MLSIRTEGPDDRAVLHTKAAALLQAEARYRDAELEYFRALAAREEAVPRPA